MAARVALVLTLHLAGCAASPSPSPSPSAAATHDDDGKDGGGVIVAIRALPPDGAALANPRRLALPGAAERLSAAAREYVVLVEGRGAVSVVQDGDARLALGSRVELVPGRRTRLAPRGA